MSSVVFSIGVWLPGGGMGNHAYQIIQGLDRHQMLARAYVMRNTSPELASGKIHDAYVIERMAYRLARYSRLDPYLVRDNLFDAWVSTRLPHADIFYSWTHHALWSLRAAKRNGMRTIVERANVHPLTYNRILEREYAQRGLSPRRYPHHPLILKKLLRELAEADYLAVTSEFTKQSLLENGIAEQRILFTPLGVDLDSFTPAVAPRPDDIFRVVYVGQLCVRKGLPYLLAAWQKLSLQHAELVLVGDVVAELRDELHGYLDRNPTIRLRQYTDNPVNAYQTSDVCVLPALEDGFGLVVLEAMACGIPVIVTEQTGAKDCVRPNVDGFIVPTANVEAIAEILRSCYRERDQLRTMGQQARQQAERFPWSRYQNGIAAHLRSLPM